MTEHMTAEQLRDAFDRIADRLSSDSGDVPLIRDKASAEIRAIAARIPGMVAVQASSRLATVVKHEVMPALESLCADLRAALAAVPAWQPIDTAPKDGTEILVWWPLLAFDDDECLTDQVVGYVRAISSWADGAWTEGAWIEPGAIEVRNSFWSDAWDYAPAPTRWQPLPAAPEHPHG